MGVGGVRRPDNQPNMVCQVRAMGRSSQVGHHGVFVPFQADAGHVGDVQ
jgi:hypothetical protein